MLNTMLRSNNFVDDLFKDIFSNAYGSFPTSNAMSTDVKDMGEGYELEMELPGYNKEDVHAELDKGYLTITAKHEDNKDEKDKDGNYIRRERYTGECQRSFYVGEAITEEDIHAAFENGILKLRVPKEEAKKQIETKKYISIE